MISRKGTEKLREWGQQGRRKAQEQRDQAAQEQASRKRAEQDAEVDEYIEHARQQVAKIRGER